MKRIVFTKENRDKTRAGIKTQTRRIGENPWNIAMDETIFFCELFLMFAAIAAMLNRLGEKL